jgi:electron transfer flavoprotein alpha subunit
MSNYIVLVKQVPDVSQITDNAFNPETGTLVRSRLQNVINELDAQALAFAHRMKQLSGDEEGQVVCLTMGPPMAEEVLRYGLSRCADAAVLLTDRALGGADTVATANPLAYAVRKIEKELFGGDRDYFIVAGMQSVDGDTAQVPPQMAEELGIGCIAYLTDASYEDGRFTFKRIISGGSQVVAARNHPVVLTVAKYEYPLFASLAGTRRARQMKVLQWGAADIQATQVGSKGSKTQVTRVFPPGKTNRKCKQLHDVKELAQTLVQSYRGGGSTVSGQDERTYILPGRRAHNFERNFEGLEKDNESFGILAEKMRSLGIEDLYEMTDELRAQVITSLKGTFSEKALNDMLEGMKKFEPAFQGEVWVVAEHSEGRITPSTFELLGKASELARSLEVQVGVALVGGQVEALTQELIHAGADRVYMTEHPLLAEHDPLACRKALVALIEEFMPQIVLYGATPQGRVLAPLVSYRLGCGLTADCTSLDIRDNTRKGLVGILLQTRPALGGNVMATISTVDSRSQMATARPGVMKRNPDDPNRTGEVLRRELELTPDELCMDVLSTEIAHGEVNFEAKVIIGGGRGLQNRDNYEALLDSLRKALGKKLGTEVEKGATRSAVEQGFTERIRQVGQTGTAVGPKLYMALGISGAIQHMIGVANTETIVAINIDPNAPIFKMCDYYLIGNVEEIVPKLVEELEAV